MVKKSDIFRLNHVFFCFSSDFNASVFQCYLFIFVFENEESTGGYGNNALSRLILE